MHLHDQPFEWAGLVAMAVGSAVLVAQLLKARREDASHGALHLVACVVGVFGYFALVSNRTGVTFAGRHTYLAHYLMWLVAEPVTAIAVAIVALPPLRNVGEHRSRSSINGGLVAASVAWIACGLFQAVSKTSGERWGWFAFSALSLAVLEWQLWRPVLDQGRIKGGEHVHDYRLVATVLTVLWPAYLVIWFFGEVGLKVWSEKIDTPLLLLFDVLTTVVVGLMNIALLERLEKHVDAEPGETAIAASARVSSSTSSSEDGDRAHADRE